MRVPRQPIEDIPERLDGDWPLIDGIDLELAKPLVCDSPVLFANMLKIMRKNYCGWIEEWLDRARNEGDSINQELCQSLHKLRGGASMLGAIGIAEEAGLAEVALKVQGQNPLPAIQNVVAELNDLLNSIGEWELRRTQIIEPVAERLNFPK